MRIMSDHGDAKIYLSEMGKKMRPIAEAIHEAMISLGCVSYVKTIYIGYDIDGEMVAALYGHPDHIEIALALPENAVGDLLVDASHLTWRTLPVAAIVRSPNEVSNFEQLAKLAAERVKTAAHNVNRDNDYFIKTRENRRGR
jgi:hypothetical protein